MYYDLRDYKRKYKSLSKRIVKMNKLVYNVISSHQYYIRQRFPLIKKRQKHLNAMLQYYYLFHKRMHGKKIPRTIRLTRNKVRRYILYVSENDYLKFHRLIKLDLRKINRLVKFLKIK